MGLQFQKDKNSSPSRQDNMAVNTGQDSSKSSLPKLQAGVRLAFLFKTGSLTESGVANSATLAVQR